MKIIATLKERLTAEVSFACTVPALLWIILFLCVPFFMMVGTSFYQPSDQWWHSFTLSRYAVFLDVPYLFILLRTLFLAFGTAIICLFLGYPVAYYLAVHVRRWKGLLLFLLTLPFWTNSIIQVYSWFFLLEYNGLVNTLLLRLGFISQAINMAYTFATVFLVMVYCYIPYMIMPLYSTLSKLDKRLLEASMDLGATRWETFKRITLPLSAPGIKAGVLLVLVPAFGDFAVPSLVGGSRYFTIGSLIVHYFTVVRETELGAALVCFSGGILLLCAVFWNFFFYNNVRSGNRVSYKDGL